MKTLWIGCSHSAGIYNRSDSMETDRGLPFAVGINYGLSNWKAISAPGQGMLEFNSILEYLDSNDLLDFDNLILQLTNEPRLLAFGHHGETLKHSLLEKYITSDNDDRKKFIYRYDDDYTHPKHFDVAFNRHPVSLYGLYRDTFPNDSKCRDALLNMCEKLSYSLGKNIGPLVKICFKNIVEICERRNINLYTFNWHGISTNQYLDGLNYDKYDILKGKCVTDVIPSGKDLYVKNTLHPMKNGVIIGSSVIKQALEDSGFNG